MSRPAPPCTRTGCGNTTRDSSGRCHLHRGSVTVPFRFDENGAFLPPLPPVMPIEGWSPGQVHPTGGYDDVMDVGWEELENADPGTVVRQYTRNDEPHREDGPAIVVTNNGAVIEEQYLRDGWLSRPDAPAVVTYRGGEVIGERYFLDGKPHRLDGPASIRYTVTGYVTRESFFVAGQKISGARLAAVREAIDSGAPAEWAIAYAEGAIAD